MACEPCAGSRKGPPGDDKVPSTTPPGGSDSMDVLAGEQDRNGTKRGAGEPEGDPGFLMEEEEEPPPQKMGLIDYIENMNANVDNWTAEQFDKAANAILDANLRKIGKGMENMGVQSLWGGPTWLEKSVREFIGTLWGFLAPSIRESLVGPVSGDYNRLLVLAWTSEYPLFWPKGAWMPQPWTWARAYFLYALFPADRSLFQKLSNPLYLLITLVKLHPYTAVPVFVLQFMFIDKSDEFQVCQFILSFKAYQFLTALSVALSLSFTFYGCLKSDAYVLGEPRSCDALLPTASPTFELTMFLEIPRTVVLVLATLLLRCGCTWGGNGELRALAEVRLDAADGVLDGFADTTAIEMNRSHAADKFNSRSVRGISMSTWRKHMYAARVRYGAVSGSGSYLNSWMTYDFLLLATIFATMMGEQLKELIDEGKLSTLDDRHGFDSTLYYIKLSWALASFPFLLFHFPIVGGALSTPYATGYSTLGVLTPKLSSGAIIKKDRLTAVRAAELARVKQQHRFFQWWHDSMSRRYTKAILDTVNPFDNKISGFESLV